MARKSVVRGLIAVVLLAFFVCAALALTFYFDPLWVNDQVVRFHLWRQGVRSEYVQVDGYNIHFLEAHPPHGAKGVPLVLVHGLGARAEDWAGMIPTLAAQGFDVYVPDLLGYGRSARPDIAYTVGEEEKLVVDFMRVEHLDRVDLGGWSMGGWIAARLTLDHPQMVDRLALYDAAGLYFAPSYEPSLFTPGDAAGLSRLSALLTPHPHALPGFVQRAAIRKLQQNAWVLRRSLAAMTSGRELLDFRLHRITQPTLIVWGRQDELIPPVSGEKMHRAIAPSVLVLVDGCGHLAPAECSEPVAKTTVEFFRSNPAPARGELTLAGHPR